MLGLGLCGLDAQYLRHPILDIFKVRLLKRGLDGGGGLHAFRAGKEIVEEGGESGDSWDAVGLGPSCQHGHGLGDQPGGQQLYAIRLFAGDVGDEGLRLDGWRFFMLFLASFGKVRLFATWDAGTYRSSRSAPTERDFSRGYLWGICGVFIPTFQFWRACSGIQLADLRIDLFSSPSSVLFCRRRKRKQEPYPSAIARYTTSLPCTSPTLTALRPASRVQDASCDAGQKQQRQQQQQRQCEKCARQGRIGSASYD